MSEETSEPLLSHPGGGGREAKRLQEHLDGVAGRAATVLAETPGMGGDNLADAASLIGLAHDFGKATTAFQRHVRDKSPNGPKHHARLGSLVAYALLDDGGFSREVRIAGLLAVARHHGPVPNAKEYLESAFNSTGITADGSHPTAEAIEQANVIATDAPEFARDIFAEAAQTLDWSDFLDALGTPDDSPVIDSIRSDVGRRAAFGSGFDIRKDRFTKSIYTSHLRLYGALTFADKTDAAGITSDDPRLWGQRPETKSLRTHLDSLGGGETNTFQASLNDLRRNVQEELVTAIDAFIESEHKVGALTLPTGYGKTFAGLLAALELRDSVGDRIVYALPFTSVIDQTAAEMESVFDTTPTGNLLTVHHHLSETRTIADEGGPNDTDEQASHDVLAAESWRTGLTLTTFVQLFESIAGPTNGRSLKLPSLHKSVIIVDEPQALPQYWWPLIRRLLRMLTEQFDARVILMTATQPTLVEDPFELIPRTRLEQLETHSFGGDPPKRVQYHLHPSALATDPDDFLSHADAATEIEASLLDGESVLTICNTVESTRTLTRELVPAIDDDQTRSGAPVSIAARYDERLTNEGGIGGLEPDSQAAAGEESDSIAADLAGTVADDIQRRGTFGYLHLTTRLRPCDRRFLIAVADELTHLDVPFVLVSTQLVEAGVDLSFDSVYRDFAPLDSLVQAAGRCNRSYELTPDVGTTTIWQLAPPGDGTTTPSEAVYAPERSRGETDLLMHTRWILDAVHDEYGATISDSIVARDAVERYHDRIGERIHSVADSNELVQAFEHADGKTLRRNSLIEQRRSFELYVCRTDAERNLAESLRELARHGRFDEVEERRSRLEPIRVSFPVNPNNDQLQRTLFGLRPLLEGDDDPERILPSSHSGFDVEFGVDPVVETVEDRFL